MHWITKDWELQDSLLDFIDLSGPHSGENLCNAFVKSCCEFGILEKVNFQYDIYFNLKNHTNKIVYYFQIFAITSDNASNNDTLMRYLETICQNEGIPFDAVNSHCRCIAHIMNIIVQDILKQLKAGEAQTEDFILDNMDVAITAGEIIPKVKLTILE